MWNFLKFKGNNLAIKTEDNANFTGVQSRSLQVLSELHSAWIQIYFPFRMAIFRTVPDNQNKIFPRNLMLKIHQLLNLAFPALEWTCSRISWGLCNNFVVRTFEKVHNSAKKARFWMSLFKIWFGFMNKLAIIFFFF